MTPALRSLLCSAPLEAIGGAAWIEPDCIIIDDVHGPAALRLFAEHFDARRGPARPEKVRVVSTVDPESAPPDRLGAHELLREFAGEYDVAFVHEAGSCDEGCSPSLDWRSGSVIASARRPDAAAAARGCVTLAAQALDLAGLLATGRMWAQRPRVQRIRLEGSLREGCTAHDVAIALRPRMMSESWAEIDWRPAPDESLTRSLCALLLGDSPAETVFMHDHAVDSAPAECTLLLDGIEPMLGEGESARPAHGIEPTDVDRVYIGSCTTGSVADLRLAARVLAGRRVHVPTVIAPASARDVALLREEPLGDGGPSLASVFEAAGCDVGLPGCAACVNALGDLQQHTGEGGTLTVVATAVANVSTRRVARVLTASPVTAAQIALRGRL